MTIDDLLEKIKRQERAGNIDPTEDSVFIRDPRVSDAAVEAGSSPWMEVEEILVVAGNNEMGLTPGIYLNGEDY